MDGDADGEAEGVADGDADGDAVGPGTTAQCHKASPENQH
jgi:hypothetical protein